jgi:hypothetical protein
MLSLPPGVQLEEIRDDEEEVKEDADDPDAETQLLLEDEPNQLLLEYNPNQLLIQYKPDDKTPTDEEEKTSKVESNPRTEESGKPKVKILTRVRDTSSSSQSRLENVVKKQPRSRTLSPGAEKVENNEAKRLRLIRQGQKRANHTNLDKRNRKWPHTGNGLAFEPSCFHSSHPRNYSIASLIF